MNLDRPDLLPDPRLDRDEMAGLQREVARAATFDDDLADSVTPDAVRVTDPVDPDADPAQTALAGGGPVVAGVDQAFRDEAAVSAVVALRDGRVVERAVGRAPLEIPYVPGLLSFREAGAIVDALRSLSTTPDLLVVDGSGRIHFRQAGIATHVGVLFDVPALGVAKNLLCGAPRVSLADPLPEGEQVAVDADDDVEPVVTGPEWPVVGYAYQSRQYPNPERRHVNPLYVSPGHRVSATTTVEFVAAVCAGYKLPEPTRLADAAADEMT